jgi:spore coat protein A
MSHGSNEPDRSTTRSGGATRRTVLKGAAAAGLSSTVPWSVGRAAAVVGSTALAIEKWEDPLPVPSVVEPTSRKGGVDYYEITMDEFDQQVLSTGGPKTRVWGYNGTFPGPTIVARPGRQVNVKWINETLPGDDDHLLSVDTRVHGAESDRPAVRTVVHVHGADTAPESDGYPDAWASPSGVTDTASPVGYRGTKEYPNDQEPATMWYHDHAIGITRLNVYAGLAAFYLLRDPMENSLPSGAYEVPIVFQDRSFHDDGSLFYPSGTDDDFEAEFFGDVPVVNGKSYPYLEVEPRSYRFRLLNGSNGRTFDMTLEAGSGPNAEVPLIRQIGTDLGFLDAPVTIGPGGDLPSLALGGAERADVLVDFEGFEGRTFYVTNDAETPYTGANSGSDIPELLQIRVGETVTNAGGTVPPEEFLRAMDRKYPRETAPFAGTRYMTLDTGTLAVGGDELDSHFLNDALWADGDAIEYVSLDTSEDWVLANTTGDAHPIHLHLVAFDIVRREEFEAAAFLAEREAGNDPSVADYLPGTTYPIPANERGPKDTVTVFPNEAVTVRPSFTGFTGYYVWHCHILEHEDQEMMLPYVIEG